MHRVGVLVFMTLVGCADGATTDAPIVDGTCTCECTSEPAATGPGYANRIPDITRDQGFVEVCYPDDGSGRTVETHQAGGTTRGGACEPGDTGYIMETLLRPAATWTDAMSDCLGDGLRLPEPFEWQSACFDQSEADVGLVGLGLNAEWASNTPTSDGAVVRAVLSTATGCDRLMLAGITVGGDVSEAPYRCVR